MLDRDPVTDDYDTLNKKTDEALALGKGELVEPVAKSRGKGCDVIGDARDACSVRLLPEQVLTTQFDGSHRIVQAFASCFQLLDVDRAALVSVDQSLDLKLELSSCALEAGDLLGHTRRSLTSCLP